ncbi:alpha-D-ribose 1-methylphosphonate 5-phosphate C-P-lyase PhnJ [Rhizobium laguerreae]|uniref:alpha-D-ribose 1-methylphosphonate 5-phosphate C-P-lyase PhnJ n=1 Tax=Rhizobium laguerreae TaxID=1076926 RepID=UPI00103DDD2A|nr:alpha-D-ribose 1-methylphosphonate 5-phosphate C-P-lyase PhnJ [Rhizobium laguerreae]TBX99052.1 carbon-phosphorus lyase complex subunit PhnJ [Rhizobium laguerreae]
MQNEFADSLPLDAGNTDSAFSFAYLDEQTKRMLRKAILKAVAIPGYQVPFASREVPLAQGWGTGGVQLTASIIGRGDVLKVIDQGDDETTNAASIRNFLKQVTDLPTTDRTREASIIQTRHRIPEIPLNEHQILVFQVPTSEPLRRLIAKEEVTRRIHANADYGIMNVRLYEDIARFGHIAIASDYPIRVNGRYIASPSPIPKFDNPKLDMNPALMLFGAGRERRVYAIPPLTRVESLEFRDHKFSIQSWSSCCSRCGSRESYLDEIVQEDGTSVFTCSDTDYCRERREQCGAADTATAMMEVAE